MNFETVLRCLDRLEHLQRTTSDLRCRPLCHLFVVLSVVMASGGALPRAVAKA